MMKSFYLLPSTYDPAQHAAFGAAASFVIEGADGYFGAGSVMDHMTRLLRDGVTFDTEMRTELGAWQRRSIVTLEAPGVIDDGSFFAWAEPFDWNFSSPLVIYEKRTFVQMFFDCCKTYIAQRPDRRDEFLEAMRVNGYAE